MPETNENGLFSGLMTPAALQLLPGSGAGLIQQIGFDVKCHRCPDLNHSWL
jgi:hypothetical protein